MVVKFWGVGASDASTLAMTTSDISANLLADWMPTLPPSASTLLMGWPPFLIELLSLGGTNYLALKEDAGRTERQWKGILSWMLGVAGARHFLGADRYRWIAPLSAFYPEAVREVDLSKWHAAFPPTSIMATRRPGSPSRFRPDYLALRPTGELQGSEQYEWAVAESKGTSTSLAGLKICPGDWYEQARNVEIRVDGVPIDIPRHLVIATRVNPNAKRPRTRCIQVRAWNSRDYAAHLPLPSSAAVEVAAAHVFGLFGSLGLREAARAIALSVRIRHEAQHGPAIGFARQQAEMVWERADSELPAATSEPGDLDQKPSRLVTVETISGSLRVEIADPVVRLARRLWRAESWREAIVALSETDLEIDHWILARASAPHRGNRVTLPFGVELSTPEDFDERGNR